MVSSKRPTSLSITETRTDSLRPATYNPRKWNETQLATLMESLSRFGFVDPVIVNGTSSRKNIVIGGHMRLEAAKRLGMPEGIPNAPTSVRMGNGESRTGVDG